MGRGSATVTDHPLDIEPAPDLGLRDRVTYIAESGDSGRSVAAES